MNQINFGIASSLRDVIFSNGYPSKIKRVNLAGTEVWRVFASDIITVDVRSPNEIVVYTTGKKKTLNSEYTARNYIVSQIAKDFYQNYLTNLSYAVRIRS